MKMQKIITIVLVSMLAFVLMYTPTFAANIPGVSARMQKNADGSVTWFVEEKEVTFNEYREVTQGKVMTDGHWMTQEELDEYIENKIKRVQQFADEEAKVEADKIFNETVANMYKDALMRGYNRFEITQNGESFYFVIEYGVLNEVNKQQYDSYTPPTSNPSGVIIEEYTPSDLMDLPDDLTLTEEEEFYFKAINEMRAEAKLPLLELNEGLLLPAKSNYIMQPDEDWISYALNITIQYTAPRLSSYSVEPQVFMEETFPFTWTTKELQNVIDFKQEIQDWVINPEMTTIGIGVVDRLFPDSAGDHYLVIYIAGDSLSPKYPMQSQQALQADDSLELETVPAQ